MSRVWAIVLLVSCPVLVLAATRPEVCNLSVVPLNSQKPPVDLTGRLPVADYLDQVMDCTGLRPPGAPQAGPLRFAMQPGQTMPDSAWVESDAARYSELLATKKYPLLVLPVQTQHMGFDFAERVLIAAELAAAFADQGGAPDPLLVARALGETRRRHAQPTVDRLTAATGAQRRVTTYAGHDGAFQMTLTVQLEECAPNGRCQLIKQRDWRNLAFTDELPPFRVVGKLRADLRRELLGKGPLPPVAFLPGSANFHGVTPAKLFASAPSATKASLLASVASTHDEWSRDRLHVIALGQWLSAATSPDSRFYAAYSALALQRRPFALALIRNQQDPANRVLHQLLDGNLPEARSQLAGVKSPLQRLLLSFVVHDMAEAYGVELNFDAALAAQVFGEAKADWQPLLERRVSDQSKWLRGDPDNLKVLLDQLTPIKGLGHREVSVGSLVAGRSLPAEQVNFRHLRQALPATDAAAIRWQAYWLLEGLALADAIANIRLATQVQGAPQSASEIVRNLEPILTGHPAFELEREIVIDMAAGRAGQDDRKFFEQAMQRSFWTALYWSQGANRTSLNTAHRGTHSVAFADAYGRDFPPRYYWLNGFLNITHVDGVTGCRALLYSVMSVNELMHCTHSLKGEAAKKHQAEMQARFHGNPAVRHMQVPAHPQPGADDTDEHIARMRAGMKADPLLWENYSGVGGLLIQRRGDFAEAQRVYLTYPLFGTRDTRRVVELGNAAYEAGSELYWKGQPDLARPLYEIAASLDTGADSSMASSARLAQLDGDFETAAAIHLNRGTRYDNTYGYRDYLSLLHALGHRDEANAAFSQLATAFGRPHHWLGALVGQRMDGMNLEQFRGWVTSKEIVGARNQGQFFAGYYAMIWLTTDRRMTAEGAKLVEEVVRPDRRLVGPEGFVSRAHPLNASAWESLRPSGFRRPDSKQGASRARSPEGPAPHEWALFAKGLSYLQAGRHQAAHDTFVELGDYYPLESSETKAAMPYLALAAAKIGDPLKFEAYVEGLRHWNQDFDVFLSRAFFSAARKDVAGAELALKRAWYVRPHPERRPVLTEYQLAEACEIVGQETGDPRFVRMMVEWARQNQRIQPTQAWSYAVEAQYSRNAAEANRALAMALYLDPASPRLKGIDEKRRSAARAWLRRHNPFLNKPETTPRPVT